MSEPTTLGVYRKKPIVIKEAQWFKNGDHPDDYANNVNGFEKGFLRSWSGMEARELGWEGQIVRYFRRPDVLGETPCRHCGLRMHVHGWIDTKEGGHIVCPGDWIITGVQGELYPCKPDIFAATYEQGQIKAKIESRRREALARLKGACARAAGFPITAEHGYADRDALSWASGWEYCNDSLAQVGGTQAFKLATLLERLVAELPTKRDWLDPELEREARAAIEEAKLVR